MGKTYLFPKEKKWQVQDEKHRKTALVWAITWPQFRGKQGKKVVEALIRKWPGMKSFAAHLERGQRKKGKRAISYSGLRLSDYKDAKQKDLNGGSVNPPKMTTTLSRLASPASALNAGKKSHKMLITGTTLGMLGTGFGFYWWQRPLILWSTSGESDTTAPTIDAVSESKLDAWSNRTRAKLASNSELQVWVKPVTSRFSPSTPTTLTNINASPWEINRFKVKLWAPLKQSIVMVKVAKSPNDGWLQKDVNWVETEWQTATGVIQPTQTTPTVGGTSKASKAFGSPLAKKIARLHKSQADELMGI